MAGWIVVTNFCIMVLLLNLVSMSANKRQTLSILTFRLEEIATPFAMQELFEDNCKTVDEENVSEKWFWGVHLNYTQKNK